MDLITNDNIGADVSKRVSRGRLWLFVLTTFVLATLIILYFVFISVYSANYSFVIPVRAWFQDQIWATTYTNGSKSKFSPLMRSLQVQGAIKNGNYTYTFVGSPVKLDIGNNLIYLEDISGKKYTFLISSGLYRDADTWMQLISVPDMSSLRVGVKPNVGVIPSPDHPLLDQFRQILVSGDILDNIPPLVAIRWSDPRSLIKIERDYSLNPTFPLNLNSNDIVLAHFSR
jgi:hypothetical protein